jgi:hypothetical protein
MERYLLTLKNDKLVESQKSRRSRGGGSPELVDLTGFPLSQRFLSGNLFDIGASI